MDGEPGHVYILFELLPSAAPSKVICTLKTQLSIELKQEFADEVRRQLWGGAFWSGSYFLTTTGVASIETVEKYIQNQGK